MSPGAVPDGSFRLGRKVGVCPRGLHPPSTQTCLLSGPALWCAQAHLRGPFSGQRVASVCSGCWLLPAQARGLDALYGEPSAPQGPTLGFGTTSLLVTSSKEAQGPPAATGRGKDVSVVSSPVCPRAEAWAGLASALSTVLVSHAAGTPHTGEGAVPLNVRRGHIRSTGREGDAGPAAKLRMGPSYPAGWRGGQEPRVSQYS
ncbi:unnamed protein product [Rangifer tarandus platyrhynchus]|uniref:Uncharacterized protein n=1 Tax=Rangifer tarandus platyrhynchus TaxID=3082113 RepID=A0AC59Y3Z8_RANTA